MEQQCVMHLDSLQGVIKKQGRNMADRKIQSAPSELKLGFGSTSASTKLMATVNRVRATLYVSCVALR